MEKNRSKQTSLFLWAAIAALLSQNLVVLVVSSAANFDGQKNYYPPDPNAGTPPAVPHIPPSHGSGGGHATPTPTPTPYHGTPPSHGGTPPVNCGNPPSGGGGHHHTTPSPPRGGGGGYYHSPPTTTPTTPTPTIPAPSGGGYYHSPPTVTPITPTIPTPTILPPPTIVTPPVIVTPPTTPIDPGTPTIPGITIPSPPFAFDPNSPPFTCTYWRNHPTLIWGLFGLWGTTVGSAFGVTSLPGIGASADLLHALSNTRTDGLGELYREGTAALLNSMVHRGFPYTTSQVRDSFVASMGSNKAASTQARLFKLANEGRKKN
ncbi:hypothetical protein ACJIZ3_010579 [Penstemon smallii]|uniref:Protodermal factor 1 n=1 Tax=Penstemon smallii TaxID=265156 RepID=A0ABD3UI47_9LAMI